MNKIYERVFHVVIEKTDYSGELHDVGDVKISYMEIAFAGLDADIMAESCFLRTITELVEFDTEIDMSHWKSMRKPVSYGTFDDSAEVYIDVSLNAGWEETSWL